MTRFFQILILGPFFSIKHHWKWSIGLLLLIGVLTIMTQVGGLIIWVSLPVLDVIQIRHTITRWGVNIMLVVALYCLSIVVIIPLLAPLGGRVPLPWFATPDLPLRPANIGYCLFARNYVRLAVYTVLERIARKMSTTHPGTTVMYLDGNFPFLNGFPLLPHLSHTDGKKLDVAYLYRTTTTHEPLHETPSPIGYWAYEAPKSHEMQPCQGKQSWLRWNFDWLQPLFAFAEVDPERTDALLQALIAAPEIQKILIEPHLKIRLCADAPKARFQGCHAARHDDHIHIQIQ